MSDQTMPVPKILSVPEIARWTGKSEAYIRDAMHGAHGGIRHFKAGVQYRSTPEWVQEWLDRQSEEDEK